MRYWLASKSASKTCQGRVSLCGQTGTVKTNGAPLIGVKCASSSSAQTLFQDVTTDPTTYGCDGEPSPGIPFEENTVYNMFVRSPPAQ